MALYRHACVCYNGAVVLRCAEMQGRIALLFAGAGIVADSDPEAELAETDAKFRSMLEALGYA